MMRKVNIVQERNRINKLERLYKSENEYLESMVDHLRGSLDIFITEFNRYKEGKEEEINFLMKTISDAEMKICSQCGKAKHSSKFSKDKRSNDGYRANCISCQTEYIKKRNKKDPLFNLSGRVRSLVYYSIKNGGWEKSSKTEEILGCSFDELMNHLNDNKYGFVYGDDGLDIDHIEPVSSAKTEYDILRLNHYTNLRLVPSYYNRHVKRHKEACDSRLEEWIEENWV